MTEEYLTHKETVNKVIQLNSKGFIIWGIERFLFEEDKILPDIGGIADFSDADIEESLVASLRFLSEYGEDESERFTLAY